MTATCETCRWWDAGGFPSFPLFGTCNIRAPGPSPYVVERNGIKLTSPWPITGAEGWCGEHQPKEPTP